DSTTELRFQSKQPNSDRARGFPRFNFALAPRSARTSRMLFWPYQNPRPIFACELSGNFVGSIVICNSPLKIIGMTDVETSGWILKNVNPEHRFGSSARIRTYDQSVNSRPLYH